MKRRIFYIFNLVTALYLVEFSGIHANATPFTIRFTDDVLVKIHKVDITEGNIAAWKGNESQLKDMFLRYNYPENIGEYKSLFYQNNFPSHIAEVYDEWSVKMKAVTITANAIFYGLLDNQEIACIQYFFTQDGNSIQMSFLAKRIEGKWYPFETLANAKYQHVMALFATLSPQLAICILTPDPNSPYNDPAKELMSTCSAGGNMLTEACLYDIAEKWGISDDPAQRHKEAMLFKNRMNQDMEPARKSAIDHSLENYIRSLQLPEDGVKKVMFYFSKNEAMKAISTIHNYGIQIEDAKLFSDLNTIQQTSQYRTFEKQIAEKPKQN